jgi:hypothetical protein
MMEAARTSETSVDNYFTRQYIPEDKSEHLLDRLSRKRYSDHYKTHPTWWDLQVQSSGQLPPGFFDDVVVTARVD